MTIKQGSDYSAIEHTGKRLMMRLGSPFCDELIALDKTSDVQTLFIFRPTSETDTFG